MRVETLIASILASCFLGWGAEVSAREATENEIVSANDPAATCDERTLSDPLACGSWRIKGNGGRVTLISDFFEPLTYRICQDAQSKPTNAVVTVAVDDRVLQYPMAKQPASLEVELHETDLQKGGCAIVTGRKITVVLDRNASGDVFGTFELMDLNGLQEGLSDNTAASWIIVHGPETDLSPKQAITLFDLPKKNFVRVCRSPSDGKDAAIGFGIVIDGRVPRHMAPRIESGSSSGFDDFAMTIAADSCSNVVARSLVLYKYSTVRTKEQIQGSFGYRSFKK